jgi:hypothetical protein
MGDSTKSLLEDVNDLWRFLSQAILKDTTASTLASMPMLLYPSL